MQQLLCSLWREEDGQDLMEYTILIAFISLATAAVVLNPQKAVSSIWTKGNSMLSAANHVN